jgi:hypothetical protein
MHDTTQAHACRRAGSFPQLPAIAAAAGGAHLDQADLQAVFLHVLSGLGGVVLGVLRALEGARMGWLPSQLEQRSG